ncbi:uncharacterized protein LOC121977412 isoform X2 [Zingiber officinale]|uniref:uncharacterized protein LOC121977412 isoform X2 n=1 Tax=Zingiber officinale TaxID=94328 RepID=UPI001C4B6D0A|nr:uncharacterized protein LOC121977412 isoform X2 [Zingiber officinale]
MDTINTGGIGAEDRKIDEDKQNMKGFFLMKSLLHKQVKRYQTLEEKTDDLCNRMNQSSRHFEDNGAEEIEQRSEPQSVTSYLQGTTNNLSFHWNLTVIKPHKEIVYVLDSLSHRICDEDWKYVMEM